MIYGWRRLNLQETAELVRCQMLRRSGASPEIIRENMLLMYCFFLWLLVSWAEFSQALTVAQRLMQFRVETPSIPLKKHQQVVSKHIEFCSFELGDLKTYSILSTWERGATTATSASPSAAAKAAADSAFAWRIEAFLVILILFQILLQILTFKPNAFAKQSWTPDCWIFRTWTGWPPALDLSTHLEKESWVKCSSDPLEVWASLLPCYIAPAFAAHLLFQCQKHKDPINVFQKVAQKTWFCRLWPSSSKRRPVLTTAGWDRR